MKQPEDLKPTFDEYLRTERQKTYRRLLDKATELGLTLVSTFEETTPKLARVHFLCPVGHRISRRKDMTYKTFQGCELCRRTNSRVGQENVTHRLLERGWEFVSGVYVDKKSVLSAKCVKRGHLVAKSYHAFQSSGCLECQPLDRIKDHSDLTAKILERGYTILDCPELVAHQTPVLVKCSNGHAYHTSKRKMIVDQNGCPLCAKSQQSSAGEREVSAFLKSLDYEVQDQGRLGKYSFDILIPTAKVAIEYHGLYYHSEAIHDAGYHLRKFETARGAGYHLFQFWEDEWQGSKPIVKSTLLVKLRHPSVTSLDARKCQIGRVCKEEALEFLKDNHLMGPAPMSTAIGLKYGGHLIQLMTFAEHHRKQGEPQTVISRLCTKQMVVVRGGTSRLLAAIPDSAKPIYTWSDNRFSEGRVYEKMGFSEVAHLKPDYQYVKGSTRYSKQSMRKTAAERASTDGKTESELRFEQGYHRIWDAGKIKWMLS